VQLKGVSEKELRKARFWQGFQNSVESESAISRGKVRTFKVILSRGDLAQSLNRILRCIFCSMQWAEVHSGSKSIARSILNGRRMDFDLDQDFLKNAGGLGKFVEDLLSTCLSFSLSSLERNPERLVKFLDAVSHLRLVPIAEIDRRGVDAFCLFVNLYHCLLQHSLLLAVNGPLHRRTVGNFMRASCYEIGGDVFSLAEIQGCIIRGSMSRPVSPRPPYVDVPKKSNAYRFYALKYADPRVSFIVVSAQSPREYCKTLWGIPPLAWLSNDSFLSVPTLDSSEHCRCFLSTRCTHPATRKRRRPALHSSGRFLGEPIIC